MTFTVDLVWTDHPAWQRTDSGSVRVVDGPAGARLVTAASAHFGIEAMTSEPDDEGDVSALIDRFVLPDVDQPVPELAAALSTLGTVARIRTVSLWEAITAAILRDHIGAYRSIAVSLGKPIRLSSGATWHQFPAPEALEAHTVKHLDRFGIGGIAPALRMAATLYARCGDTWETSSPEVAVTAVQTLHGVDEATARIAVADWSGRFDLYPLGDPSLRAWAMAVSPRVSWPTRADHFARFWAGLAGDHLHHLTGLLAAWAWKHQPFRPTRLTADREDGFGRNRSL